MAVVSFDPAAFRARYPAFTNVTDAQLIGCFQDAGLYLSNTDTSPVQDLTERQSLLWMLTAHIAQLEGALNGGQAVPVGRLTSASEGSVSASFSSFTPGTGEWFQLTQYGARFWQATIGLRSATYFPQPVQPYATNGPRDFLYRPSGYRRGSF